MVRKCLVLCGFRQFYRDIPSDELRECRLYIAIISVFHSILPKTVNGLYVI